jgi:hypothetical protein
LGREAWAIRYRLHVSTCSDSVQADGAIGLGFGSVEGRESGVCEGDAARADIIECAGRFAALAEKARAKASV